MRLVAIAAGLAVLSAAAWFTIGPGTRPPTGACAATGTQPVTDAKADPGQLTWIGSGELPDGLDDDDEQLMLDIESFRDGFVAVGRESSGPISHAFVLHSAEIAGPEVSCTSTSERA